MLTLEQLLHLRKALIVEKKFLELQLSQKNSLKPNECRTLGAKLLQVEKELGDLKLKMRELNVEDSKWKVANNGYERCIAAKTATKSLIEYVVFLEKENTTLRTQLGFDSEESEASESVQF